LARRASLTIRFGPDLSREFKTQQVPLTFLSITNRRLLLFVVSNPNDRLSSANWSDISAIVELELTVLASASRHERMLTDWRTSSLLSRLLIAKSSISTFWRLSGGCNRLHPVFGLLLAAGDGKQNNSVLLPKPRLTFPTGRMSLLDTFIN
jgi:hypothetical protein